MGETTSAKMIGPGVLVGVLIAISASLVSRAAGVSPGRTAVDYVVIAAAVSFICFLLWIGYRTIELWRNKTDNPLPLLRRDAATRLDRLVLSALIAPLFFAEFTTAKTCIARLVGFRWDRAFTDIDAAIFGADPWRLTHALLGPTGTWALAFFYTVIFGFALAYVQGLVAMFASRRTVGVFFLALFLTWFVGGILAAYALSSAGPVFAGLADPTLQARFAPLTASLSTLIPGDSLVAPTQHYLASAIYSSVAVRGGGISAMPSMHIGSAMLYVMLARGTKWQWAAVPFLALTWLGSVHFGYHYAIDGAVAIPIAVLCWYIAQAVYRVDRPASRITEVLV